jgi:hypothetical protein
MKKLTVMVLALAVMAGSVFATPLVGRSGAILKPFQLLGWLNAGWVRSEKGYNWDSLAYISLPAASKIAAGSAELTASIGLPGKLEFTAVAPLLMKQRDTLRSSGLGDVMVYARYGVLQSPLLPVKLAATLGVKLPTSSKDANPALGRASTDIGLGLSALTMSLGKVAVHARGGYWLNGKINDTTKLGNQIEYLLVGDYAVSKCFTPELALSGLMTGQGFVNGIAVPKSQSSIHNVGLLLMFKPLPKLVVRPKVSIPLEFLCKGASVSGPAVGLDVWANLP